MKTQQLSVVITTFNEQHNIAGILDSVVGFADEVMVVDSFSTDQTLAIIYEQYPSVKIHQRQYFCPAEQKNWAIPQAKKRMGADYGRR